MGNQKQDAIDSFMRVITHLTVLHKGHEKFAMNWMWNDPRSFQLFQESVLGLQCVSKNFLANGYTICRREASEVFPADVWSTIDDLFLNKRLLSSLPKPVRKFLRLVRSSSQTDLQTLVKARGEDMYTKGENSQNWWKVSVVAPHVLKGMEKCFLGDWITAPQLLFDAELAASCKVFPPECVVARSKGNLTYFYEKCGDSVNVIAAHVRDALEPQALNYIRPIMEDLFINHHAIIRRSMATLDSTMTGFGPLWKRFEKGGGMKVSFYTHVAKLSTTLRNLPMAKEFEVLADRYSHSHLAEIILSLFIWKLPTLVGSFFDISKPFLGKGDYDLSSLEADLDGGCGPCAYQLYITKDFCSEIHKDDDSSDYTLTYCSHPDAAVTPVQFIMAEHGVRIELGNGSIFGFKSSVSHGTAYRNRTHQAAYMGCLVVNNALHALTRRRQNRCSSNSGSKRKVTQM